MNPLNFRSLINILSSFIIASVANFYGRVRITSVSKVMSTDDGRQYQIVNLGIATAWQKDQARAIIKRLQTEGVDAETGDWREALNGNDDFNGYGMSFRDYSLSLNKGQLVDVNVEERNRTEGGTFLAVVRATPSVAVTGVKADFSDFLTTTEAPAVPADADEAAEELTEAGINAMNKKALLEAIAENNLEVEGADGISAKKLRPLVIEAAKDEGLFA